VHGLNGCGKDGVRGLVDAASARDRVFLAVEAFRE
jgi:hypothetical protein